MGVKKERDEESAQSLKFNFLFPMLSQATKIEDQQIALSLSVARVKILMVNIFAR